MPIEYWINSKELDIYFCVDLSAMFIVKISFSRNSVINYMNIRGRLMGAEWADPPPNRRRPGKNQAGGPVGNGLGGPRRRKIGRIGGPKVGRGSGAKVKMFIPIVNTRIY